MTEDVSGKSVILHRLFFFFSLYILIRRFDNPELPHGRICQLQMCPLSRWEGGARVSRNSRTECHSETADISARFHCFAEVDRRAHAVQVNRLFFCTVAQTYFYPAVFRKEWIADLKSVHCLTENSNREGRKRDRKGTK